MTAREHELEHAVRVLHAALSDVLEGEANARENAFAAIEYSFNVVRESAEDTKLLEDLLPMVTCSACGNKALAANAHRHQGEWIGDRCCWDERLRMSE